MKEQLLQFIWQYQYFNRLQLHTEAGEPLQILSPGDLNTHQGPDFLHAAIRIGHTGWVGNIELHIKTSDWTKHAHQNDKFYRNVILHVVWANDIPLTGDRPAAEVILPDEHGSDRSQSAVERNIPLLVLQHRVPKLLLGKYEEWMARRTFIACEGQLPRVGEKTWTPWKRQLLERRLYRKTLFIRDCLEQNHQHWEETAWWLLARNVGLPVNSLSFEAMARSLPILVLARHRGRVEQLEALLLGQTGLLEEEFEEDYPLFLQREFRYLRKKYRLPVPSSAVLFLRMRPGNFPSIRLAQLAGLLSRCTSWFAAIKEADSFTELMPLLRVTASPYWDTHYSWGRKGTGRQEEDGGRDVGTYPWRMGDEVEAITDAAEGLRNGSTGRPKKLGKQMMESILINTAAPLLYAYGWLRGEKALREKALWWLTAIPAEKNALIAGWGRQGVYGKHAADTQALRELKCQYCDPKKCLQCAVGHLLLGEVRLE